MHSNSPCRPNSEPSGFRARRAGMTRTAGFGLVELMVALTIGLFITGGMLALFIGSKQTYKGTDALGRIQENARFAFHVLSRDIRMAGYRGCAGGGATFASTLNLPAGELNSFAWNFSRAPLEGFESTGAGTWSTVTSGTPAVEVAVDDIDADVVSGTDALMLRSADSPGIRVTGQPAATCDPSNAANTSAALMVTDNTVLANDQVVMVTNCANATVFQITNFNTATNVVVHNTGGTSVPGNSTQNLGTCYIGGEIVTLSSKAYYVRLNPAGVPTLYRRVGTGTAEEVVQGVENMQIEYGLDATDDSQADSYVTADAVTDWNDVVSVRISLLMRSVEPNTASAPQPYRFDGATVTPTDRFLRQVVTTTVAVRNKAY